jgi:hypothetical protein
VHHVENEPRRCGLSGARLVGTHGGVYLLETTFVLMIAAGGTGAIGSDAERPYGELPS